MNKTHSLEDRKSIVKKDLQSTVTLMSFTCINSMMVFIELDDIVPSLKVMIDFKEGQENLRIRDVITNLLLLKSEMLAYILLPEISNVGFNVDFNTKSLDVQYFDKNGKKY